MRKGGQVSLVSGNESDQDNVGAGGVRLLVRGKIHKCVMRGEVRFTDCQADLAARSPIAKVWGTYFLLLMSELSPAPIAGWHLGARERLEGLQEPDPIRQTPCHDASGRR